MRLNFYFSSNIKIVIVTTVMVILCRKSNDKNDIIYEGDDENEAIKFKKNLNIYDEEVQKLKVNNSHITGRLSAWELADARKKRIREVLFWKLLREFIGCAIFLGILYQYSFSNRDNTEYAYKHHLTRSLARKIDGITRIEHFWKWIIDDFTTQFDTKNSYYNNDTADVSQLSLRDLSSNIIGYVQLKQNRVEKGNLSRGNLNNKTKCKKIVSLSQFEFGQDK